MCTLTASSCIDLARMCMSYGVECKFQFLLNESLAQRARNYIADEFLRSDFTEMIFIDADIVFTPQDALTMVAVDEPIVAGPYPKKVIDMDRIVDAVRSGFHLNNNSDYLKLGGDIVMNVEDMNGEISVYNPTPVKEAGTGFLKIRREVYERFREAYPENMYRPDHNRSANFNGKNEICAFYHSDFERKSNGFDTETNRYLSEDYYFLQKCRQIGYKIMMLPWLELSHVGTIHYQNSIPMIAALENHKRNGSKYNTELPDSIGEQEKVVLADLPSDVQEMVEIVE